MIRSFEIVDPDKMLLPWWSKVPALAKSRTFEFKPGINILWGQNGSGKTTILKALARVFHCEQSGNPVMTEASIAELFRHPGFGKESEAEWATRLTTAFRIDHDGQGVRHFDPSHAVGLMGSGFDWDFGMEGLSNAMVKGSSGQTTMRRINQLVGSLADRKVPVLEQRVTAERVNSLWVDRIHCALKLMEGSGDKGPPTILLDEPERSFDIPNQVNMWRFIRSCGKEVQFLVASHTLFALDLPEANYIEMNDGYLANSRRGLQILKTTWVDEKPLPYAGNRA